ncbi:hypothetical protein FT641_27050 [Bacillus paranthracis]|uniref:type II toxin-antitoxin system HicA family toxin n=1 Tax=Bacillus paranthracis TaxID=2026186 RepID=UPI000BFC6DB3|nr:hypothetical protein [Bacillus paranthracis]MBE7117311.1 hypothetical protein [Bacillus paranthracis]MBE7134925.1 hypothetical protein [Bacillus paranthracis]MBE7156334.1 hypothetical protein [Bacillus paranthracis]PGZ29545.1 hypothetical protein COE50_22285 [Bacillus anthracis]
MAKKNKGKKDVIRTMSGKEYAKLAESMGWYIVRKDSSHYLLNHPTIPGLITIKPTKEYVSGVMKRNYKVLTGERPAKYGGEFQN